MTDFRALCAELLDELKNAIRVIHCEDGTRHISSADQVIAKVDAALAEPEPEGPTPQPIWVIERLPGPEDCDTEGRCWWWEPDETDEDSGWWILLRIRGNTVMYTHWLPAHALPLPS